MIESLPLRVSDLVFGVLFALVLYLVEMPGVEYFRLDFVALLVLLFAVYRDKELGLVVPFLVGLTQDLVSLAPLGMHALGLMVAAYLGTWLRDGMRVLSLTKQLPFVLFILVFVKLLYAWVSALGFGQIPSLVSVFSAVVVTLFWPLCLTFLKWLTFLRHRRSRKAKRFH